MRIAFAQAPQSAAYQPVIQCEQLEARIGGRWQACGDKLVQRLIEQPRGIRAQPLPFLDYLVSATQQAAALAPYGALVNVPEPARFMWHKLAVAAMRPAAFAAKRKKSPLKNPWNPHEYWMLG